MSDGMTCATRLDVRRMLIEIHVNRALEVELTVLEGDHIVPASRG